MYRVAWLIIILSVFCGCSQNGSAEREIYNGQEEYALFFRIIGDTLKISNGFDDGEFSPVWIKTRDSVPSRVVCMSTGHIAYLSALGVEDAIVAVSGGKYISNKSILNKIDNGVIKDIGYENSINYEELISLKPDIVFAYGIPGENNSYIDKIKRLGIKVMVLGDYLENHPLGKLEFIKLFGVIFNRERTADSIYVTSKKQYIDYKNITSKINNTVQVILNAPWKESWYIPGSTNYMSVLINDAGGIVVGSKNETSSSIPMSVEEVFEIAHDAPVWLHPNNYSSIAELSSCNPLFKRMRAIMTKNVYNNTKLSTDGGGSDFWERGVIEPHIILKDLIKILHPGIIPDTTLIYYKKLY